MNRRDAWGENGPPTPQCQAAKWSTTEDTEHTELNLEELGALESQALPLQIEALARDAQRASCGVEVAAVVAQRQPDHLVLDLRDRGYQLVLQRHDHLEIVVGRSRSEPRVEDFLGQLLGRQHGVRLRQRH